MIGNFLVAAIEAGKGNLKGRSDKSSPNQKKTRKETYSYTCDIASGLKERWEKSLRGN